MVPPVHVKRLCFRLALEREYWQAPIWHVAWTFGVVGTDSLGCLGVCTDSDSDLFSSIVRPSKESYAR